MQLPHTNPLGPVQLPHTNPVGLPIVPPSWVHSPRRHGFALRALAAALAATLLLVASVTTAVSLGAYCLTTDTSNVTKLPAGYRSGVRQPPRG